MICAAASPAAPHTAVASHEGHRSRRLPPREAAATLPRHPRKDGGQTGSERRRRANWLRGERRPLTEDKLAPRREAMHDEQASGAGEGTPTAERRPPAARSCTATRTSNCGSSRPLRSPFAPLCPVRGHDRHQLFLSLFGAILEKKTFSSQIYLTLSCKETNKSFNPERSCCIRLIHKFQLKQTYF